jgi:hypothetical protein
MVAPVTPVDPVLGPLTSGGEPLAVALHRLAAKAHAEGLAILDDLDFAPYACRVTSSQPGQEPYVVSLAPGPAHGCDCKGYFRYERCKHYALCLEAAGWLPDLPDDPPPGAPAPLAALPRSARRALAAADLAARYPSLHPARPEDREAA